MVEGLLATEAALKPALAHSFLKAPVCSWSDTASKGEAIIALSGRRVPAGRESYSPTQRIGSSFAGHSGLAERAAVMVAAAAARHSLREQAAGGGG